mgnify:CR=1 FL=1
MILLVNGEPLRVERVKIYVSQTSIYSGFLLKQSFLFSLVLAFVLLVVFLFLFFSECYRYSTKMRICAFFLFGHSNATKIIGFSYSIR